MFHCLNCSHVSEAAFKFCPDCGTEASAPTETESLLGRVLNQKYRVLEEVGSGAMGTVYRAEQVSLKKPIAIKVLHDDLTVNDESVRRFQAEGIAAGKFSHPAAIQIFDFDKDESGNWFLAMEFVEGTSLREFLETKGALSADGAIHLTIQILDALGEAHRQKIVHRDLKPDNIMIVGSGSGELFVKVLDFGLSKLADQAAGSSLMTQTGRILGTPRYMAPEQWQGAEVDHRIDIYAVGLVLYEMVTGESPVTGTSVQDAMVQSQSDAVPSLLAPEIDVHVPDGLDEIVGRALAKDREDRYQTADEMIAALEAIDTEQAATRRRAPTRRGSSGARRARPAGGGSKTLMFSGIAVAVIVVIVLAVQFLGGPETIAYARVSQKPAADRSAAEVEYMAQLEAALDGLRERKLDDALAAAERAKAMDCADSEVFLVRARIFRARFDDDAATLACEQALKLDDAYTDAITALGWIHFDRADWAEAAARFDAAQELDAEHKSAKVGKASILTERGAEDEAREMVATIEVGGETTDVAVRVGDLFLKLGEAAEAASAFRAGKLANAFDWRAHAGLGEALLRDNQLDKASEALFDAVRLNADAMRARTVLATFLVEAERWPEALQTVDEGLSRRSTNGRLHILRGIVKLRTGDSETAIQELTTGLSRSPRDHRAWTLLGILHQRRKEYDKAVECYESAQGIDRNDAQPFLNHGLCLMMQEEYEKAEPLIRRATEIDKENAYAFLSLGILLRDHLGNVAGALQALQTYKKLGGTDPRVDGWIQSLGGK